MGKTLCCCLGSEHICKELLTVAHLSLQKAESTLQQDIESDAGWYQEERSPKAKTPNAALLQRWLLVPVLSFAFPDNLSIDCYRSQHKVALTFQEKDFSALQPRSLLETSMY